MSLVMSALNCESADIAKYLDFSIIIQVPVSLLTAVTHSLEGPACVEKAGGHIRSRHKAAGSSNSSDWKMLSEVARTLSQEPCSISW